MNKEALVKTAYEAAKERYAEIGIDTEKVLNQLKDFHLSMHCWQADDVAGLAAGGHVHRREYRDRHPQGRKNPKSQGP